MTTEAGPEPSVTVSLSVNDGERAEVHTDQPITLYVSLANNEAQEAALHNDSVKEEMERVRREAKEIDLDRDEVKKKLAAVAARLRPVRSARFGGQKTWTGFVTIEAKSGEIWARARWPFRRLSWSPKTQVAEIDAEQIAFLELGVDPADVSKIPKGVYELRASIELVRGVASVSRSVTVELAGKESSADARSGESFITDLATYYIKRGMGKEAEEILTGAISAHPGYVSLQVLMGDILLERGDVQGALRLFEQALADYRKLPHGRTEEPEALIDRIHSIQSKMLGLS